MHFMHKFHKSMRKMKYNHDIKENSLIEDSIEWESKNVVFLNE